MIYLISENNNLLASSKYISINTSKSLELIDKCVLNEIQIDTETKGLCPHLNDLLTIQLGTKNNQFVFDLTTINYLELINFLNCSDKLFIAHNIKFDYKFLLSIEVKLKNVYCTQLAEQVINNGKDEPFNLASLTQKYLDISLNKDVRNDIIINGLTEKAVIYAAEDVKHLSLIKEKQLKKVANDYIKNGVNYLETINLENEVVKVFSLMEFNGVTLDVEKWKTITDKVSESLFKVEKDLDETVKKEPKLNKYVPKEKQLNLFDFEERDLTINWKSSKQKLSILKDLGLNIKSTGAEILQKNKKYEIVKLLLEYNKLSKLNSSFGNNILDIINKKTNKIHPDYWQIVETGRISCKNPNLLNIPSKGELGPIIRSAFTSKKGYKWVGGDYSGRKIN